MNKDRNEKGQFVEGNNVGTHTRFKAGGSAAAEMAAKGHAALVKANARRKSLAERLLIMGEQPITNNQGETLPREDVIALQVAQQAAKGDLKAARLYAELTGQLTTKLEVGATPPPSTITKEYSE